MVFVKFLVALFIILSFAKLGGLVRAVFLTKQQSSWYFDAFVGLVISSFLLVVLSYTGLSWWVLGFTLSASWAFSYQQNNNLKTHISVGLVFFVSSFPLLVQSFLTAKNFAFAEAFFNVDTPFTLMIAESILQNDNYPVKLLENEGMALAYHYGYHSILAFISYFSGLRTHVVHAFVLMPFLYFLLSGLVLTLLKKVSELKLKWLAIVSVVVLYGHQLYVFNYFNPATLKNLIVLPGRYLATYPLAPSSFEPLFILAVFWLLLLKTNKSYGLAAILIGLIPVFKIPLAPVVGLGFGLFFVARAIKNKSIKPLAYPLFTVLFMAVIYRVFSASLVEAPPIELLSPSHVQKDHLFSAFVPLFILLIVHFATNKKLLMRGNSWMFFFVIPMPLLLAFIKIDDVNSWQLIAVIPFTACLMATLLLVNNWPSIKKKVKVMVVGSAVLIAAIPVANAIYYASNLIRNPELGHEYCNNVLLAETLQKIPVKNTVLATNDLRYPADGFSRDGNQFQFSALFGHQMKVSNLSYLVTKEFVKKSLDFQRKLPNKAPSTSDFEMMKNEGVTHFVLAISDSSKAEIPVVAYRIFNVNKGLEVE